MSGRSGKNTPKAYPGRQPSLNGLLVVDTVRGAIRVRKWPKPRGKNRNATNIWWSDWLREAMIVWRFSDPRTQALWRAATQDLPVKVTDPYMQAVRGTIWYFVLDDGTIVYPVQARDKVSYSLDIITQLPGGMLVRGSDTWQGIEPAGDSGLVLFSNPDRMPQWGTTEQAGIGKRPVGASAAGMNTISIPTNTFTTISWNSVNQDTTTPPIWTASDPTRFYAPTTGWYGVTVTTQWSPQPGMVADLWIFRGEETIPVAHSQEIWGGPLVMSLNAAANIQMAAGDYVHIAVEQTSGSSQSIPVSYVGFVRLG